MIHAFLLTVIVQGAVVSNDMYFASVHICQEYAHALVHGKHKNVHHNNTVSAYCIPKKVNPEEIVVYTR
jgi:hypothetical protein